MPTVTIEQAQKNFGKVSTLILKVKIVRWKFSA